jgi:CheY-like chemotaxis protein
MPFPPDGPGLPDGATLTTGLPLRGVTVLLVEDSRLACDAMRLIFQRAGARLRRADSLAAARAHLACYRPDLVIADLGLPDGRGEDLIAETGARGIAVLGISGDPDGRAGALERLVRQLVAGVGAEAQGAEISAPTADPAALRDDLARAAALAASDAADPAYVAGFVRGLARTVGDAALEAAALQATANGCRAELADLLAARLGAMPGVR